MLDHLERELKHLKGSDIVIEADFTLNDLRNDGFPRAGARVPVDPGVILSLTSIHGPLRLPCDHFKEWQQNLRAVGLHLEMLRRASMYGVGQFGEAYKGWARLGSGAPIAMDAGMNVEEAALLIAPAHAGRIVSDVDAYRMAYRLAAKILYPGNDGALRKDWDALQRARAVLDAHHGLAKTGGGGAA